MDQPVANFISQQPSDRQGLLTEIHSIIVSNDKTVVPVVEPMMGKEMIVYKAGGAMKYALSNVKKYLSLHLMPIYCQPELHAKYKSLLTKADFQKGCINFDTADKMPLEIVTQLLAECATFDFLKYREKYLADKKQKSKS